MGTSKMDLEGTIRSVVEGAGLELVEANLHRTPGRSLLRVTVDREGGVDLDAIADASGRISRRLDLEGFDPGPYALEVSSPGIERPLKDRPRRGECLSNWLGFWRVVMGPSPPPSLAACLASAPAPGS